MFIRAENYWKWSWVRAAVLLGVSELQFRFRAERQEDAALDIPAAAGGTC